MLIILKTEDRRPKTEEGRAGQTDYRIPVTEYRLQDIVSYVKHLKVTIATGLHLFPFRTEKLSPLAPMVLLNCGRVGSRPT